MRTALRPLVLALFVAAPLACSGQITGDDGPSGAPGTDTTTPTHDDSGVLGGDSTTTHPGDDSSTPGADTTVDPSDTTVDPSDTTPPPPPTDSGTTPPTDTAPPPPVDVGTPVEAGDPGTADVTFKIDSTKNHGINPLVYGTNGQPPLGTVHETLLRSGGNRLTAFNWENNASNAGSDWCYQNDNLMSSSTAPGAAMKSFVELATGGGAAAYVTIPIVDYVAADELGGSSPPGCSGDVRKSGAGYLSTRMKQNKSTKGSAFSLTPNTTDGFVYQDEFVNWLKATEPTARVIFAMDNEPDLWADTHPEVHSAKVGYDELCSRNVEYAKAVKAVWPSAEVTGFVSYGWAGFTGLQGAPDASGKGEFVDYFLDKMKAAEASAGKRLIDYLDLHWYPEAQGGGVRIVGNDTSDAVVSAREQAPRSLWDSTYKETSWIVDAAGSGPIDLIHRELAKIAAHYPGTKLAISEWNYGGGEHISGAIASADVLGIFGRDGVSLASQWPMSTETFTYAAFMAYRNYDGAGGHFGDLSLAATNTDVVNTSVYASMDSGATSKVVIIAINKAKTTKNAAITLSHPSTFKTANVFTITASAAKPVAAAAITAVSTNAFRYAMPAQSISILVPQP